MIPLTCLIEHKKFEQLWKGAKSIVKVESEREINSVKTTETRYYISSLKPDAKKTLNAVRKHWSVENSLHWRLDFTFGEDQCRVRIGQASENFSLLRKIALICLKEETSLKGGIQTKRLKAGWDMKYLKKSAHCIEFHAIALPLYRVPPLVKRLLIH